MSRTLLGPALAILTLVFSGILSGGEGAPTPRGVWARVTLLEPADVKWRVHVTSHYAMGKHSEIFAAQTTAPKKEDVAWVAPGQSSCWISLSALIPKGTASVCFKFESEPPFPPEGRGVRAKFDVGSGNADAAIVRTIDERDTGALIALRIPADLGKDSKQPVSIREDTAKRLAEIKALKLSDGPLPKKIWCMTGFRSNGQFYSDPAIAEMDFDSIRLLGMNGFWEQNGGQPRHLRALAQARGINRSTVYWRDVESPPRDKSGKVPLDWNVLTKYMDDTYRRAIERTRAAHPQGLPTLIADLMDEPAGAPLGGSLYQAEFREYMRRQGFSAEFFGMPSWEQVEAPEFNWRSFFKQRAETNLQDERTRRVFYWGLRFWNHCAARLYAMANRKVEEYAPGVETRVNFGPPWWYDYGTLPRGIDIFEFGKLRGVTLGFNEDWCGTGNPRLPLELNTLLVDWSRAASRPNQPLLGSYITRDADRSAVKLRAFACLARECKIFDFYYYGPAYTFFDHWSDNASMVQGVGELTRDIGQADEILWEGRAPRAQVALLFSHSWPVWKEDDSEQCEQMMVYLALLHAGIAADIVSDAEVADGRFASRQYKCLYAVNESIPAAAAAEIERWVRGGGKLWLNGWAGMKDEYNTRTDAWNGMLGIKERAWKPTGDLARLGKIIEPADYRRPIFAREVSLQAADGSLAAVPGSERGERGELKAWQRKHGAGEVQIVPWSAGKEYMNAATEAKAALGKAVLYPSGAQREIITGLAQRANVQPAATTSVNQVLAWPLWGQSSGAILIANFTGEAAADVTVSFVSPIKVKSLRSLRHGDLSAKMKQAAAGKVEIALPVNDVTDILVVE